jgi:cupin fold WbuC family metalloprotein
MKTEKLVKDGIVFAIVVRSDDWEAGVQFVTSDEDYQQLGFWGYDKGQKSPPHTHLDRPREVPYTQEVLYIKQGAVRFDFYTKDKKVFKSVDLKAGDTIALLNKGTNGIPHGAEVLEDNTKYLEVKMGPFTEAEEDRKRIFG